MAAYPSSEKHKMIETDLKEIHSCFKHELNVFKLNCKDVNRYGLYFQGTALSLLTSSITNFISSFFIDSLLNKLISKLVISCFMMTSNKPMLI